MLGTRGAPEVDDALTFLYTTAATAKREILKRYIFVGKYLSPNSSILKE